MTKMNVVIPVYNQAYALSLTLHGLTRQAAPYNRCPVIVVDDGSEEPVHAVAEAYRGRLNLTYVRIPRSGRAAPVMPERGFWTKAASCSAMPTGYRGRDSSKRMNKPAGSTAATLW